MEKFLYVHVVRFGETFEEDLVAGCRDATNDWYVIKQRSHGGDGVEMSRVFEEAGTLNYPSPALRYPGCDVIGSCIYVIGGHCFVCHNKGDRRCRYEGSAEVRCLDTRKPKDGWRTCFTLPLPGSRGISAVVDDRWLYIFPAEYGSADYWCYAFNVADPGAVRKISLPDNCFGPPLFCTGISPGMLVAYAMGDGTLYQLDCEHNTWSVHHKDFPYTPQELISCPIDLYDGILYIYQSYKMQLISYDIRNKKELHVVDLPKTSWFGLHGPVELIVLSMNTFCLMWDTREYGSSNKTLLYYTRFSVSYHLPNPTVVLEEKHSFAVVGCRVLNILAVDPHANSMSNNSKLDVAAGEKPLETVRLE